MLRAVLAIIVVATFVACPAPDPLLDLRSQTAAPCDNITDADGQAPGEECTAAVLCAAHCCNCGASGPAQRVAYCKEEDVCGEASETCERLLSAGGCPPAE